jgi:MFS family permease
MLRLRGVWTTNAAAVLVGFNVFTHAVLIPQFVQSSHGGFGFGASIAEVGLYMLPTLVGMLAASLVASAFAARVGSRPIVVGGAFFTLAAFVLLTVAHDQPWNFYVASLLQGVGAGCAYASLSNLIVEAVSHAETGVATGLNLVLRAVGGALGSQVAASIIAAAALTVGGFATERGFTIAFAVSAGVAAASVTVALLIPR